MRWQEELKEQIASLKPGSVKGRWPNEYSEHRVRTSESVCLALRDRIGHINEAEVAGIQPGRLLLDHISFKPGDFALWLSVRHGMPWNRDVNGAEGVMGSDGKPATLFFPEVLNERGEPLYPPFDFTPITGATA